MSDRAVSSRVNTTSRRGINQLRTSFGSIFLLFSNESSRGLLGMGYLLATHCCPDKLALNGPKSLTHDVRF